MFDMQIPDINEDMSIMAEDQVGRSAKCYVVHLGTGHRQQFPCFKAAEKWLNDYRVSQTYKDQNYKIVIL